jgi:hypothetical protein
LKAVIRSFAVLFFIFHAACALISDQPSSDSKTSEPKFSLQQGASCFSEGNLSCARENYCGVGEGEGAKLRCCAAQFLESYFSEDSAALAQMLGYQPVGFAELRAMGRTEIVEKKTLLFGEFLLVSKDEPFDLDGILTQWGAALSKQQTATAELSQRLTAFGAGLEPSVQCLSEAMNGFTGDELEAEFFGLGRALPVTQRDLKFVKAVLAMTSYEFQGAGQYDWGFAQFPSLPLDDAFLQDVNGQGGEDDARFGNLSEAGISRIVEKFPLLVQGFDALKAFSLMSDQASEIDAYLNWRIPTALQERMSAALKAAYVSLKTGEWQDIPETGWRINLFSLSHGDGIPKGQRVSREIPVLIRNDDGEITAHDAFFKAWGRTILKKGEPL